MSYEKAWRCREKGLMYSRGTPAAAYSQLPGYFYVLEQKNPGTITDIITEDNRFKYCFWSLAACRRGFKFCRPVISIDGTFLKTSENHDSWKYFLQKLKEAIGEVENLVFVSDRHQSIEHAVEVIFPEACHCACYKHISMNVTHKFKTDVCNTQIWLAAYAWSKRECDRHLQVLRQMDPPIAAYVDNIGLEKWARPYCLGDSLIKQHEDGRRRSVLRNGAQLFNVGRGADGSDFEKGGDVNLVERTCTCGMFQLLKIPCPHACAAAFTQNVSVYALSSPYYTKETWKNTYDATINVVGEEDEWVLPEHMQNMRIGVPVEKKPVGRPRKSNAGRLRTNRFPSNGQKVKEPRKCSNCGALGHNKATCKARV
ncbi:hypothetical protein CsatA_014319 [Cannabis sativa]